MSWTVPRRGDVTEATVIDAHSRRVIGWAIAEHMRTDLVEQALQMTCSTGGAGVIHGPGEPYTG